MISARKTAITVCIVALMLLSICPLFSDIGEDFEKAGMALSGAVSFYYDFSYFLDRNWPYHTWYFDAHPSVDFFMIDNLSFEAGIDFLIREDNFMQYGLNCAFWYSFVPDPNANNGFALRVGLALSPAVNAGVRSNGDSYQDLLVTIAPQIQLVYFITDRISPYFQLIPTFGYYLLTSEGGAPVTYQFVDRLYLQLTAVVGITYWIPRKDQVMIRM